MNSTNFFFPKKEREPNIYKGNHVSSGTLWKYDV